ncbi:Flp pilus assembly protein TadG [Bradyrhizobium sp. USDA 4341]
MHSRKNRVSAKRSLIADQRGTVAFEMPIVYLFLLMLVLLPLSDLAIAGYKYASAWDALRAFGQSIQYSPPPDVTNSSSWASTALAKADSRYPITSITLICGDSNAVCSSANTQSPKFYSYSTTITLTPMVLRSALCTSGNTNTCSYTLPYTERFQ